MLEAGAVQDVAAVVGVALIALVVLGVVTTVSLARRTWRRCRRVQHEVLTAFRGGRAAALLAAAPVDAEWWRGQRDRRRLWRAVIGAERAVAAATAAGAPVGDLPALARQVRRAANAVDAALTAAPSATAAAQLAEVVAAAHTMRAAAAEALAGAAAPVTGGLREAVRVEAVALRHGLAQAGRR